MSAHDSRLPGAALPTMPSVAEALEHEWRHLARPGPTLDGATRVAVASEARAALDGRAGGGGLEGALGEATSRLATRASTVDAGVVADLERRGLARQRYAEVVAVVARLSAVDAYALGVGAERVALPEPEPGEPTGEVDERARLTRAFVPTVQDMPRATTVLDVLPAENGAVHGLHGALYLRPEQIQDWAYQGELSRAQMELVAARTSHLNHCRY